MPDPRDDLIRRSEITRLLTEADDRIADPEDRLRVIANTLTMLPADPVAAAAVALAEKIHPHIVDISEDGPLYGCCACSREWRDVESHEPHCALAAYRAALAGRERGR